MTGTVGKFLGTKQGLSYRDQCKYLSISSEQRIVNQGWKLRNVRACYNRGQYWLVYYSLFILRNVRSSAGLHEPIL